jgi:hypothetical protein
MWTLMIHGPSVRKGRDVFTAGDGIGRVEADADVVTAAALDNLSQGGGRKRSWFSIASQTPARLYSRSTWWNASTTSSGVGSGNRNR